jgi:hypothetical protein
MLALAIAHAGGDIIELRPSSEGHAAEVFYSNEAGMSSNPGIHVLELDEVRVQVRIAFAPNSDAELFCVTVLDDYHVAFPADCVAVEDGQEAVTQVMRPMF